MSLRRGFTFASASVVLVSSAQLGMRWSMTRVPEPTHWLDALRHGERRGRLDAVNGGGQAVHWFSPFVAGARRWDRSGRAGALAAPLAVGA